MMIQNRPWIVMKRRVNQILIAIHIFLVSVVERKQEIFVPLERIEWYWLCRVENRLTHARQVHQKHTRIDLRHSCASTKNEIRIGARDFEIPADSWSQTTDLKIVLRYRGWRATNLVFSELVEMRPEVLRWGEEQDVRINVDNRIDVREDLRKEKTERGAGAPPVSEFGNFFWRKRVVHSSHIELDTFLCAQGPAEKEAANVIFVSLICENRHLLKAFHFDESKHTNLDFGIDGE
jgi:hypothetical protein